MNKKQIEAELRLFKSYSQMGTDIVDYENTSSIEKGILYTSSVEIEVKTIAEELYGIKPEQWNNTFHKSFSTVKDMPIEKLLAQQILHYFTTYGLESLDLYDSELVYIPHEKLEIPELQEDVVLTVIKYITEEQLKEKLMTLLTSGIALSQQTIDDIMLLSDYINLNMVDEVKNKEVRIALYDKYHIVPGNNEYFLRYLIKKLTGETLLIKNNNLIQKLKECNTKELWTQLNGYVTLEGYYEFNTFKKVSVFNTPKITGYEALAQIFLRYKPLFLAMKRPVIRTRSAVNKGILTTEEKLNKIINKISKLAKTNHVPQNNYVLDFLTTINTQKQAKELIPTILDEFKDKPVFREIRALNAIKYRLDGDGTMLYKIRNGKAFVKTPDSVMNVNKEKAQRLLYNTIYAHLTARLSEKLKDKTVYIPSQINYTVPTSEKQFNGNIPEGSYIEIKREDAMVVGIHWKNRPEGRVDLDLHAQNRNEQFGWNTSYRGSSDQDFFFTGDITDAVGDYGATELFYIGKSLEEKAFLLTVNNYSSPNTTIPFEFIIAKVGSDIVKNNYVIDPNNVVLELNNEFKHIDTTGFESRQKTLGFIKVTNDYIRLYFNDFELGNSIVTRQNDITKGAYDYLYSYADIQLTLKQLLKDSNVQFVNTPIIEKFEETEVINNEGEKETLYKKITIKPDYNLDLNEIDKVTLIDLFGGV